MTDRLDARIRRATSHALEVGALQPIETHIATVSDRGVDFVVRVVDRLRDKDADREARGEDVDPFEPYDRDLFVAELSRSHVCLLNKYNVLDHHVLVVTREFEPQRAPLGEADFEALWRTLDGLDGLGFYNAGPEAGASESHKHLQVVPFPLAPRVEGAPLSACFPEAPPEPGDFVRAPELPFEHRLASIPGSNSVAERAVRCLRLYREMCAAMGVDLEAPTDPYNLLVTDAWMLAVPRSREHCEGISINALGFAGALLARDDGELERIRRLGPMSMLESVATS